MSLLDERTPTRRLPIVLGLVAVAGLTFAGGVTWALPRPAEIVWEGEAPTQASLRRPVPIRTAKVLDQWGDPVEDPPLVVLSTSSSALGIIDQGHLVPRTDGIVDVTATVQESDRGIDRYWKKGDLVARYAVTLDLPPDLSGTWVSREDLRGGATRVDIVRATPRAPEVYTVTNDALLASGDQRFRFLLTNTWTFLDGRLCEDNPRILPPDAPVTATRQCSSIRDKKPDAIVLHNPDAGPWKLTRATAADYDAFHAVVLRDLDALRAAEATWRGFHGGFLPVADRASTEATARKGPGRYAPDTNAVRMNWRPLSCGDRTQCVSDVGYWVEGDGANFTAHAFVDSDGDGVLAEYVATAAAPARRVSDGAVR